MRIELAYPMTAQEIATAIGAFLTPAAKADTRITAITTDSREVRPGDCFIALCGERFDGNNYLGEVYKKGCIAAIGRDGAPAGFGESLFLKTADTVRALGALASYYANLFPHKTVAVTGSVGKTTTKECICAVLKERFRIHATSGNLNNELGLPYTILSAPRDTEVLILEMGMSDLGEIATLSTIARPDIGLITTIGTSHLEHLGTRDNICRAKMEITEGMANDALLLLSGDEPLLARERSHPLSPHYISTEKALDHYAINIRLSANESVFDAVLSGTVIENLSIPMAGKHAVSAALFALAVGHALGLDAETMRQGLLQYMPSGLRQSVRTVSVCGKDITLITDCYNAAPESMRAALSVCAMQAKAHHGRAVALLGDMKELGKNSEDLHRSVGAEAYAQGVSLLCTYGTLAASIAEGAHSAGMPRSNILMCKENEPAACASALANALQSDDTLLVKASRAMRLEDIISRLLTL